MTKKYKIKRDHKMCRPAKEQQINEQPINERPAKEQPIKESSHKNQPTKEASLKEPSNNETLKEEWNSKEDDRIYTLKEEKPAKAVVKMGVPLIAGMFIMVLYNLTDTFFIGLLRDDYQLAAVNLAYPVMMVMIAISNITGSGAGSLIARSMGEDEMEKAEQTLTSAFVLTAISSLTVSIIGIVFLSPIVRALGAKSNTDEFTQQYIFILLIGAVCVMGNYIFGQLLRSEGSVRISIVGMVAGTIANIALDPLFIFVFGLEIRGAAVATVIGNGIGMAASALFYVRGKTLLRPSVRFIRPKAEIIKEIFWVGVPASLETLLTSAAYIVLNNLAVSYGELTVAAMGISQKILSLGNYVYQGFASGVQPLMGYNYGAGNFRRMLAVLRAGLSVVSGTELAIMAVCGIFAPQLIGLFTGSSEVIQTGSHVLRTIMWILPFVGAVSMSRMSFQAMGKPQFAFGITLVRQLILYVPMLLVFDHIFGFDGMIWAQPVTEFIMMIVSVWLLVRNIKNEEQQFLLASAHALPKDS